MIKTARLVNYSLECTGVISLLKAKYLSAPEQNSILEFSSEIGTPSTTTINITNKGNETLIINSSQLVGEHSGDFTVNGEFPINILDVNDSKMVTVQCTPLEKGKREANLEFVTNDKNAQLVNYSLKCTGVLVPPPPKYLSIPEQNTTLGFSSKIGTPSDTTISIANSGNEALIITSFQLVGKHFNDFKVTGDFPISLNANDSKMVTVQCTPSDKGKREANLEFVTNDKNAQLVNYSLECTGVLVPPPLLPPPKYLSAPVQNTILEFNSEIDIPSAITTISITNGGDEALIISSSKLVGENPDDFTVTGEFPISLNANDSKEVTIQCTPSEKGERKANLEFVTNDQNFQLVSYFLECTGIKEIVILPPDEFEDDDTEIILPTKTFEESSANLSYNSDTGVANFLGPDWGYTIEQPNPLPDSTSSEVGLSWTGLIQMVRWLMPMIIMAILKR